MSRINPEALPVLEELLKMLSANNRGTLALIKQHREYVSELQRETTVTDMVMDKFESGWIGIEDT
jgi:hypothetical protein